VAHDYLVGIGMVRLCVPSLCLIEHNDIIMHRLYQEKATSRVPLPMST
jgi:hypothetical protein